jgi:hypothetical protein
VPITRPEVPPRKRPRLKTASTDAFFSGGNASAMMLLATGTTAAVARPVSARARASVTMSGATAAPTAPRLHSTAAPASRRRRSTRSPSQPAGKVARACAAMYAVPRRPSEASSGWKRTRRSSYAANRTLRWA